MSTARRIAELERERSEQWSALNLATARIRGIDAELSRLKAGTTAEGDLSDGELTEAVMAVLASSASVMTPTMIIAHLKERGRKNPPTRSTRPCRTSRSTTESATKAGQPGGRCEPRGTGIGRRRLCPTTTMPWRHAGTEQHDATDAPPRTTEPPPPSGDPTGPRTEQRPVTRKKQPASSLSPQSACPDIGDSPTPKPERHRRRPGRDRRPSAAPVTVRSVWPTSSGRSL